MDGSVNVGVFTESGSLKHWNILADGVTGRIEDNSKVYYLKDHLGSTRAVINETGGIQESHDFYPFGLEMPGRRAVSDYPHTKEMFTGKERDEETGLDYFGARYYDATIGRWLSVDPLAEYPSPYIYVGNSPVILVDPSGLFSGLASAEAYEEDGNIVITKIILDNDPTIYFVDEHGERTGESIYLPDRPSLWDEVYRKTERKFGTGIAQAAFKPDMSYITEGTFGRDVPYLAAGMTGAGLAANYGVATLMTQFGDELSAIGLTSAQQVSAWMNSIGYSTAIALLSAINTQARLSSERSMSFYLSNKLAIDEAAKIGLGVLLRGSNISAQSSTGKFIQQILKLGRRALGF